MWIIHGHGISRAFAGTGPDLGLCRRMEPIARKIVFRGDPHPEGLSQEELRALDHEVARIRRVSR